MPASLRPNLLATLALATTISMTGCIFPFTRSSDTKLAELATEDPNPQPKQQVAAAPKPEGEKKLPPFARFIGGMFGGDNRAGSEPQPEPVPGDHAKPTQRVAEVPTRRSAPPSVIKPARDLVDSKSEKPVGDLPANNMPVVVTPDTNKMADKPDVVSRFSQKATQLIEKPQPEVAVQPKPQPVQTPTAKPRVAQTTPAKPGNEALDAHARAPWEEKKLLEKAMANSSTNSTTLENSLELVLEAVRRERLGEASQEAVEANISQSEVTAQAVASETTTPTETPATLQPEKVAANPLRPSGTKTDWSGSSLRSSQPQTITNNTLTKYPQTDSKWAPKLSPSQPAPEKIATKPEPAADPQVTVNPYANSNKEAISATPKTGPQLVNNDMPVDQSEPESITTDEIHFQSSLLNKLQAANRQAKWDFSSETKPAATTVGVATNLEPDMPKIVENETVQPGRTEVASQQPETTSINPQPTAPKEILMPKVAQSEPKTTISSTVAQPDTKEAPQVIKPFIIAEPARATPSQGGLIRPVEPQPLVMENQDGNWQNASATPAKPLPKLAPVVRASDYQSPDTSSGGSKTYIVN